VGYTGGTKPNPTYHSLGDHSESIEIEYDPTRISYRDLLRIFWGDHNPTARSWSRQYRAAIFYHDEAQKRLAEETRDEVARRLGKTVRTAIEPAGTFTPAEDYHQKYWLRQVKGLMREFHAVYPNERDFAASTAAARVNGFVGGNGTRAQLDAVADSLGLSSEALKLLRSFAVRHAVP
jgi:peptide-methionine (S)-S-oxide reductase